MDNSPPLSEALVAFLFEVDAKHIAGHPHHQIASHLPVEVQQYLEGVFTGAFPALRPVDYRCMHSAWIKKEKGQRVRELFDVPDVVRERFWMLFRDMIQGFLDPSYIFPEWRHHPDAHFQSACQRVAIRHRITCGDFPDCLPDAGWYEDDPRLRRFFDAQGAFGYSSLLTRLENARYWCVKLSWRRDDSTE